jgi:hypothetical protein
LACDATAKKPAEVRDLAVGAGLKRAKNWNISGEFRRASTLVANTSAGWELIADGRLHVAKLVGANETRLSDVATSLRTLLNNVTSPEVKAFLEEAVSCFEHRLYRAAIVFSWVGAVAILHKYVFDNVLSDFNKEAQVRTANSKEPWKPAKRQDDLGRLSESTFLQVIESIGVISKNEKQLLEEALKLRNAFGHPTSVSIAENTAAAHIERLTLNVYKKF